MKSILPAFLLAISCFAGRLSAQQPAADDFTPDKTVEAPPQKIKYVLLMPEDKVADAVKTSERNPFGKTDEPKVVGNKATSEENSIRGHLEKLKIVGVSPGPTGMRIMLGNMVLEAGEIVPPVVPDQTLNLRVGRITDHSIELVWIESKPSGMPPRLLTLPFDKRLHVRYALLGQTPEKTDTPKVATKHASLTIGTKIMQAQSEAPASDPVAKTNEIKLPEAPPAANTTPAVTDAIPATAAANAITVKNEAGAEPAPNTPNLEPEGWKRAVGYMNNLVKLEESKK